MKRPFGLKRWQLAPAAPDSFLHGLEKEGLHPLIAQTFYARGYHSPAAVLEFLRGHEADDNPFQMKGMLPAVYRIRRAIRAHEPIAVYGDFDADGVTSTTILSGVLAGLGAEVRAYIPDRIDEGYGLNSPALKHLADDGVRLVITVDCGIRSLQEVADGNHYGLDLIVTDHHSVGPELPDAQAVINPQQFDCDYPEKRLAGVGVTYKLVQALFMEAQRRGYKHRDWRPEDWLDLVAIGTVADVMPLLGENRTLVSEGLKRLRKAERPGILALCQAAAIKPPYITASTIGFGLGPRINAAGRLRSAMLAYELLSSVDYAAALPLATELNLVNQERQAKTEQMQAWAEESLGEGLAEAPLVFATDRRFEQGVVGLVASRLTDTHYRPSVVVQLGGEESHGSCRSIPEFHITHALDSCSDLFLRYGGHAAAAGFTARSADLPAIRERLLAFAAEQLAGRDLAPLLAVDAEVQIESITLALAESLQKLEPTGEGNRSPRFMARNLVVQERHAVGSSGQHLRLALRDDSGAALNAIAFRRAEWLPELPERIDLVFQVGIDDFRGRQAQLLVEDIRPAQQ